MELASTDGPFPAVIELAIELGRAPFHALERLLRGTPRGEAVRVDF